MSNEKKRLQRFLLLEFLDSNINGLLSGLRRQFSDRNYSTDIHITVRGPYSGGISGEIIRRYQSILSDKPLQIYGIGTFSNPGESVVYIKVAETRELRKICWKRDYPKKFGFTPHISLYRGPDAQLAEVIRDFLCQEDIKLTCDRFRFTPFASRQEDMFTLPRVPTTEKHFLKLFDKHKVRPGILDRAGKIVESYEQTNKNQQVPVAGHIP